MVDITSPFPISGIFFDDRALLCIIGIYIWQYNNNSNEWRWEQRPLMLKQEKEECNLYTNWISMRPQAVAAEAHLFE